MTAIVGTPAASPRGLARTFVPQAIVGVLIGVTVTQVAPLWMSLGARLPAAQPRELYFMLGPEGGLSLFAVFVTTGAAVWLARRAGGTTAAVAAVAVLGLSAALSTWAGMCFGNACKYTSAVNGSPVAMFLSALLSLYLRPRPLLRP